MPCSGGLLAARMEAGAHLGKMLDGLLRGG